MTPKINIAALDDAIAWAADEKLQAASGMHWLQTTWLRSGGPECGTAGCVAGRIVAVDGWLPYGDEDMMVQNPTTAEVVPVPDAAARIVLGPELDRHRDLNALLDEAFYGFNALADLRAARDRLVREARRMGAL